MLMELYEQRYPFKQAEGNQVDLLMELQSVDIQQHLHQNSYPEYLGDFLAMSLEKVPECRPTAVVLLQSEWFKYMGILDLDHAVDALNEWVSMTFDS